MWYEMLPMLLIAILVAMLLVICLLSRISWHLSETRKDRNLESKMRAFRDGKD